MRTIFITILFAISVSGCAAESSTRGGDLDLQGTRVPRVKENSGHLIFSWFEAGKAHTATRIQEVPESVRKEVRVQDPTIPPEQRNPDIVYLADLSQPKPDGTYPVRPEKRVDYEARRHPPTSPPTNDVPKAEGTGTVIMYATTHCPYCHKARRWLLEQKIPYREIDIEKDEAAAEQLEQKGRAQGVAIGGVPMFEVNGRLLPGFDPDAILSALSNRTAPAPTAAGSTITI